LADGEDGNAAVSATIMKPLAYTPPYVWIFSSVMFLAYLPEFLLIGRSKPQAGEKGDRGSLKVILLASWIGMIAGFSVAGVPAFILMRGQRVWFGLGIACLVLGASLRQHCFRTVGRYFTGDVKVVSGQSVIEAGAYRWVRHPSYSGGILLYLGTGLALTNWLSALIIAGMGAVGYAYRVKVEERALQASLGEPYQEYMRRTKRFVPYFF
jgi:protein-S-isoprenylcysteine O-methyltransferase Ste14